jgi:alpha-1,2-mannosyltransferase
MIGSCKDEQSEVIVRELTNRISKEHIPGVEILKNISFTQVKEEFSKAAIGVHFMVDEHFGISIVELLCAGMVVLAHNSAGPKEDILANNGETYGILCENDTYFEELKEVCLSLFGIGSKYSKEELVANMEKGRAKMKNMVSNVAFAKQFYEHLQPLLTTSSKKLK